MSINNEINKKILVERKNHLHFSLPRNTPVLLARSNALCATTKASVQTWRGNGRDGSKAEATSCRASARSLCPCRGFLSQVW